LDAIISVGYRIKSNRATQFRIWDFVIKNELKSLMNLKVNINKQEMKIRIQSACELDLNENTGRT